MDYRGYGDSVMKSPLSESTVVEDAKAAIKLIRDNVGDDPKLIIYGHSMGTGIASHAAAESHKEGLGKVDGIILDSPFHSFKDGFKLDTTLGSFLNYVLDLEGFLKENDIQFDNPK